MALRLEARTQLTLAEESAWKAAETSAYVSVPASAPQGNSPVEAPQRRAVQHVASSSAQTSLPPSVLSCSAHGRTVMRNCGCADRSQGGQRRWANREANPGGHAAALENGAGADDSFRGAAQPVQTTCTAVQDSGAAITRPHRLRRCHTNEKKGVCSCYTGSSRSFFMASFALASVSATSSWV